MKFELRQFNTTLLIFEAIKKELEETKYNIVWINDGKKNLLPIGLNLTSSGLEKWLSSRVIPKNREFVEQLLTKSGLSHNDTIGIISYCKGLSLNDSYWIVEENFNGKFEDYNLYENNFTRTLALVAYTGYGSITKKGFTSSPEYTTNGMLRKCWRRINSKIFLYKGGTTGAINAGNEPYSEFYASQVASTMQIKHINYGLSKWKGLLCSTCELFTDINTSYVPIFKFIEQPSLLKVADFLKKQCQDIYDDFIDMLIFDALIFNTDRHYGNFGLLVDNATNQIKAFAPIFDNGMSLFNFAMEDDLNDLSTYSKTRLPAFSGVSFEEIIKNFITERQKIKLRHLINFKFQRHIKYNLPKKRLTLIEQYLQIRIKEIIN